MRGSSAGNSHSGGPGGVHCRVWVGNGNGAQSGCNGLKEKCTPLVQVNLDLCWCCWWRWCGLEGTVAEGWSFESISALPLWLKTDWLSFLLQMPAPCVSASMHHSSLELQAKITSSIFVSQAQKSNYCVAGKGGLNV